MAPTPRTNRRLRLAVVGATSAGPLQQSHGFLLRDGAGGPFTPIDGAGGPFTPIDVPGAPGTVGATGIDDAGTMVGNYTNPNATPSPQPTRTPPMGRAA